MSRNEELLAVNEWKEYTKRLAQVFVKKYYPNHDYDNDCFLVSNNIGDMFFIDSQDFYDLDRMIQSLELNATFEQLQNYHDIEMEYSEEGKRPIMNFENYVKYGMEIE